MPTSINAANLQVQETFNFSVPCEGAKVIPLLLDFSVDSEFDLDLSLFENQSRFTMLQTIYVDLSDTASPMVIVLDPSGLKQTIVAMGHTEGYYTVLVPNPSKVTLACASGQAERVHLINVPIAGVVWAATHP